MAKAGKGMGAGTVVGHQTVGEAPEETIDEDDIAEIAHGLNRLQGDDQGRVHNQRTVMPGTRTEPPEDFDDPAKPEGSEAATDGDADI